QAVGVQALRQRERDQRRRQRNGCEGVDGAAMNFVAQPRGYDADAGGPGAHDLFEAIRLKRWHASGVAQLWIEHVTDAVAEEVEAKHGEENCRARSDDQPWVYFEVSAARAEHRAPRRRWWLYAQPQKGQCGLIENGEGNAE